jgi:hypothetical protein
MQRSPRLLHHQYPLRTHLQAHDRPGMAHEVTRLLTTSLEGTSDMAIADLLSHVDRRVRQLMAGANRDRLASENLQLADLASVAAGVFGKASMAEELLSFLDRLANTDSVARHQAVMGIARPGIVPDMEPTRGDDRPASVTRCQTACRGAFQVFLSARG